MLTPGQRLKLLLRGIFKQPLLNYGWLVALVLCSVQPQFCWVTAVEGPQNTDFWHVLQTWGQSVEKMWTRQLPVDQWVAYTVICTTSTGHDQMDTPDWTGFFQSYSSIFYQAKQHTTSGARPEWGQEFNDPLEVNDGVHLLEYCPFFFFSFLQEAVFVVWNGPSRWQSCTVLY